MSIENLKAIAAKRNKPHWTHKEFLQFVSKEDREFFIVLFNCADEMLAVVEAAIKAIPEMICTCTNAMCAECRLHESIEALHTKIKTELGE